MAAWATPEERRAFGRSRRKQLHRADLSRWSAKQRAHDPLRLMAASMKGRLPQLVALKYDRMMASPFGYFRGAVPVMAADMAQLPHTGILSQICGDAHVRNLGAYASPDGRLLFDINDFDETTRGPFEWDGRRLAASLVLAARAASIKKGDAGEAVHTFAASYRKAVRMFAAMPVLDAARYQVHRLQRIQPVSKALLQAERSTPQATLQKLTIESESQGHRIFQDEPPLLVRLTGAKARGILGGLAEYRRSLLAERRHILDQYRPLDAALKVVGTGSVGLRDYVVYCEGNGPGDPLFLQIKEEVSSAYEPYLGPIGAKHQGQRVVEGQRAMQLQSDPFLGWTTIAGRDYLVRQLSDFKGSLDLEQLKGEGLTQYAIVCGELLARGHARSGDACVIAGYLGNGKRFAEAILEFAEVYAEQTNKDWAALLKSKHGTKPAPTAAKAGKDK